MSDKRRPWWKEPMLWLVLGLPAIAVVASFTSFYFAARDPDPILKSEYSKVGLAMVAPADEDDAGGAAARKLSAHLSNHNSQLVLVLAGRLASQPKRLILEIRDPDNKDMRILLANTHDLTYIAAVPNLGVGMKKLMLEPEDRSWHLTGQWMAPYTGTTELGATHPSTHP